MGSGLEAIIRRRRNREIKLQTRLDSMVEQLKEMGATRIVLFGSVAKGEVDLNSDLDLLVIMPPGRSGKAWMQRVYDQLDRGVASDILVYNQEEFERALPTSTFLRHVMDSGRILYEGTI